jgi:hypothetical protein
MTVAHEIDHDTRSVRLTISGEVTDEGLLQLGDLLGQLPGVRPDYSLLFDARGAEGSKLTSAGVRTLASQQLIFSRDARRGVVVPSLLGYGMARMYELFRGEGAPRVFMDYDKGRRWVETGSE